MIKIGDMINKVKKFLVGKKTFLVVFVYMLIEAAVDKTMISPEVAMQAYKYLLPIGLLTFSTKINRLIDKTKDV